MKEKNPAKGAWLEIFFNLLGIGLFGAMLVAEFFKNGYILAILIIIATLVMVAAVIISSAWLFLDWALL